jgi:hypothetical protein
MDFLSSAMSFGMNPGGFVSDALFGGGETATPGGEGGGLMAALSGGGADGGGGGLAAEALGAASSGMDWMMGE